MNIRPSALLRRLEDGVVGAGRLVGSVAHATRLEYTARKLADANVLVDTINREEELADRAIIADRTEQLIAKRRAAARKAQGKAKAKASRRVVR